MTELNLGVPDSFHGWTKSSSAHFSGLKVFGTLLGDFLDILLAINNCLDGVENGAPVLENGERNILLDAVLDEVVALLCKQQVGLLGGTQITNPISGIEQCWTLSLWQSSIGSDLQRLVMAEVRSIVKDDLPADSISVDVSAVSGSDEVADNPNIMFSDEVLQQGFDDGFHSSAEYNDGNVVGSGIVVELLEVGVQLDMLDGTLQALVKGKIDRIQHFTEGVSEGHFTVQDSSVEFLSLFDPHTEVVGHEVIGITLGDGAIEVGEEDVLWRSCHGVESWRSHWW